MLSCSWQFGIGRTALLEFAAARTPGALVLRTTGAGHGTAPTFAGPHGLLAPAPAHVSPDVSGRSATLTAAIGLSEAAGGTVPDRFRVAVRLMRLPASAAERQLLLAGARERLRAGDGAAGLVPTRWRWTSLS
ncbi:hypothetical protein ACIBQ5_33610 [Streptomyces massasporeus]|uniref:hypothetical protein n=1 Tax=Streptomyces massasporeus TaxID=67324 RepID=UPI0037885106